MKVIIKIYFLSSESIDFTGVSAICLLIYKNILKNIWHYQKIIFIFALAKQIIKNKSATQSTTYKKGKML